MGIRARFGVLEERPFRLLFLGRTASLVGDGIAPIALAFAVLDLTGSATDLGLVLAGHSLVLVCLVLVGGVYADRISPRLAMLGADTARAVSTAAMAALLIAGVAQIWELAALYAVDGAATAFFNPASDALVPAIVGPARLQEASALLNFSRSAGRFVGPALAGIVLAIGSPGDALAIDAATFAISAACLVRVRAPRVVVEAGRSFLADLREGWSEFSARSWLWGIVAGAAVINAVYFPAIQVLGPAVAVDRLGGSGDYVLIVAGLGVGTLVGSSLGFVLRPSRPLFVGEGLMLLLGLPVALLALPAPTALIALGALVSGVVGTFGQVIWESTWVRHVPEAARSRVSAYDWFGSLALEPLGLALIGPVAAGVGLSTTLWLVAALMVVFQAAILCNPAVRNLRADPGQAPGALQRSLEPGD